MKNFLFKFSTFLYLGFSLTIIVIFYMSGSYKSAVFFAMAIIVISGLGEIIHGRLIKAQRDLIDIQRGLIRAGEELIEEQRKLIDDQNATIAKILGIRSDNIGIPKNWQN